MRLSSGINGVIRYWVIVLVMIPCSAYAAFDPNNPGASGYVLSFDDEFDSLSSIDVNATKGPGYKWYVHRWFGYPNTPESALSVSNGILIITPTDTTGYQIATAGPSSNPQGYVGQAFGGGFYIEGRISFDNTQVVIANSWPAFWGLSLQALLGASHWPGQPAEYNHALEDDFFEYDTFPSSGANSFGGSMHDWYGIYNVTCPPSYCSVTNSNGVVRLGATIWTNFHTIGQLYIVGSSANGNQGSVSTYFDGVLTSDVVTWTDQGDGTPPPSGAFAFSIMDKESLVIILGTGTSSPMNVDWVHVWQPSQ